MKYLQLIRKKLLPLLLSVAVIGSQVPVMAGDFDAEETKESIAAVSSGESDEEENIPSLDDDLCSAFYHILRFLTG